MVDLPDAPWATPQPKSADLPDAPWATSANMQPGEAQAKQDIDIIKQHQGFLPQEVKTGLISAGEAGLFDAPTYIRAKINQKEGQSFEDALNEERRVNQAYQRQNPVSSAVGTGAGIVGGAFVPIPGVGPLGSAAAKGAELIGGGKIAKGIASGATQGTVYGGLSGASEKYGTEEFTPQEIGKSALFGAGTGAVLTPALESALAKGVSPKDAQTQALLESQGITPSRQMITGKAAEEGAPAKTADEMTEKAKEILAQKQQSMLTPDVNPFVGSEGIVTAKKAAYDPVQKLFDERRNIEGTFRPIYEFLPPGSEDWKFNRISFGDVVANSVKDTLNNSKVLQDLPGGPERFLEFKEIYPQANKAHDVMMKLLNTDEPLNLVNAMSIQQQMNAAYTGAKGADRAVVGSLVDGYKKGVQNALEQGLFTGETEKAVNNIKQSNLLYSQYKKDFEPKYGAESSPWGLVLEKMIDSDTGKFADKVTPEMLQGAEALLSSKVLDPNLGPKMYQRLERTVGQNAPEAMEAFNASLRNKILTPQDPDNLAKLPKQIRGYTTGPSLPVTLKAFGAKTGDLTNLVVSAADDAATQQAKQKILDLQNFSKAIDLVYARPGNDEAKKSWLYAGLKKLLFPFVGAAVGIPHGAEAVVGALAGQAVGQGASTLSGIMGSNAQRAGAPRMLQLEQAGRGVPMFGRTMTPARLNIGATEPVEEQPGYGYRPVQRASGGRINGKMTAEQLLANMEAAKKKDVVATKPLLKLHDTTVAHALAIANQHI